MAGLGLDGITLAMLGCDVLMVERETQLFVVAAGRIVGSCRNASSTLSVPYREGDVRDVLVGGDEFDTVYLDPMFPPRDKAALPRKSAQVLGDLLGAPDDDLRDLVSTAIPRARGVSSSNAAVTMRRARNRTGRSSDAACASTFTGVLRVLKRLSRSFRVVVGRA